MMKFRSLVLIFAFLIGVVAAKIAVLFAIAGAGMFGTPFQGDSFFNITLLLVWVFGPFAILPLTLFDTWKPGWGGLLLCGSAVVDVGMICLNNIYMNGFSVYNAVTASASIALPVFAIGSLVYFSGRKESTWSIWIWGFMLALLILAAIFFAFKIGPDFL